MQNSKHQVIILGGTGLIGKRLSAYLVQCGYEVIVLTRKKTRPSEDVIKYVTWNGHDIPDIPDLRPPYSFINLAGENISNGRWTEKQKEKILNSRLLATEALRCFVRSQDIPPETVIQGSAIGYYDNSGIQCDENSGPGTGFLPKVVQKWEQAMDLDEKETKALAFIRTGVVLDNRGGAFPTMLRPFNFYAGGIFGSGNQFISWIHWLDEVRAIEFIIQNRLSGIFNLVSPNPVKHKEFQQLLSRFLKKPLLFHYPSWLIKILLGEMGETLLLKGEHVSPGNLLKSGFRFKYPYLEDALTNLISSC